MANALDLLTDEYVSCSKVEIDDSIDDLKIVHTHERPYTSEEMAGGDLYMFTDEFIQKVIVALSTDSLEDFTADELELWSKFVS